MSNQAKKQNLKRKLNQKTTSEHSKKSSISITKEMEQDQHSNSSTCSSQEVKDEILLWEDGTQQSVNTSQDKNQRLKLISPTISKASLQEEEKGEENTFKKSYVKLQPTKTTPMEVYYNNSSTAKKTNNSQNLNPTLGFYNLNQAQNIPKNSSKISSQTIQNIPGSWMRKDSEITSDKAASIKTYPLSSLESKGERSYRISSKDGSLYSILIVNGIEIDGSFRRHKESELVNISERKYGIVNNQESENYGKYYTYLKNINNGERMKGSWRWISGEEYERVFGIKDILQNDSVTDINV